MPNQEPMQLGLLPISPVARSGNSAGLSGRELKKKGMDQAARTRRAVLGAAISTAKYLTHRKSVITIDDVFEHWQEIESSLTPKMLGAAAGSVFKTAEWEFVAFVPSTRPSNNSRYIRSWRLKCR